MSERKKEFLSRLQTKYRKKIFAFVSEDEKETITIDGKAINLAWTPHLEKLSDSHNEAIEVLFEDCIVAIKERITLERKKKRRIKKACTDKIKQEETSAKNHIS